MSDNLGLVLPQGQQLLGDEWLLETERLPSSSLWVRPSDIAPLCPSGSGVGDSGPAGAVITQRLSAQERGAVR